MFNNLGEIHIFENDHETLKHELNTKNLSLGIYFHKQIPPPGNIQFPHLI